MILANLSSHNDVARLENCLYSMVAALVEQAASGSSPEEHEKLNRGGDQQSGHSCMTWVVPRSFLSVQPVRSMPSAVFGSESSPPQ